MLDEPDDDPLDALAAFNDKRGRGDAPRLAIGSDVEIARRVRDDLQRAFGLLVHAEGAFWRFEATCWRAIPEHEMRVAVHSYDGASFLTPASLRPSSCPRAASTPPCMRWRPSRRRPTSSPFPRSASTA